LILHTQFYPYLVQFEVGKTINETVNLSITIFLFIDKKVTLAISAELADIA